MFNRELLEYSHNTILAWQNELYAIPEQLVRCEQEVRAHTDAIANQKPRFDRLNRDIAALNSQISSTQSQLYSLQAQDIMTNVGHAHESEEEQRRRENRSFLRKAGEVIVDASRLYQINSLQNTLTNLEREKSRTKADLAPYAKEIDRLQGIINGLTSRIGGYRHQQNILPNRIAEANTFVTSLRYNPEHLVNVISQQLISNIKQYSKDHRKNQSVAIRICLVELESKINYIRNGMLQHQKYAQLCGLLWHTLDRLNRDTDHSSENKEFASIIHNALCEMHIQKGCGLPDGILDATCLEHYEFIKQANFTALHDMSESDLTELEETTYSRALQEVNSAINLVPQTHKELIDLANKARAVAEAVDADKKATPDVNHYTSILQDTLTLLQRPTYAANRANYKKLAAEVHGSPHRGKQIGGAMLAFLGAVAVVAGLTAAACFVLYPATLATLAVSGISPILTDIMLPIALGTPALMYGMGFFKEGKGHGLSKAIENFGVATEMIKDGTAVQVNPPVYQQQADYPNIDASELPAYQAF